jgi:hypothetical protein
MNNERRDMYHQLVCEHRKLSDEHCRIQLELTKKGNLGWHIFICRITFIFVLQTILPADTPHCADTYFYVNIFQLRWRSKSLSCWKGWKSSQVCLLLLLLISSWCSGLQILLPFLFLTSNLLHHYSFDFKSSQMRKQHLKLAIGTASSGPMWPSNWKRGMPTNWPRYLIRLKRIYNFLCSMLVFTPFA